MPPIQGLRGHYQW